ncbi:MAG: hypothetical protein Q9219_000708 [cf. Caloplaca sp. 3 TL-2023]
MAPFVLEITKIGKLSNDDTAGLLSDVAKFMITLEGFVCDLIIFTNPKVPAVRALWREAAATLAALSLLLNPGIDRLLHGKVTGPVRKGALPALHYLNTVSLTFDDLRNNLKFILEALNVRRKRWFSLFQEEGMQMPSVGWSPRPLSEVVVEAMLLTRKPQVLTHTEVQPWLGSIHLWNHTPYREDAVVSSGRLTERENLLHMKMNPDDKSVRPGQVAVLCFFRESLLLVSLMIQAKMEKTFATGSTLIHWGNKLKDMEFVKPGSPDTSKPGPGKKLHEWFREERQARFSKQQQKLVNVLVERFTKLYHLEMVRRVGLSEADLKTLPRKDSRRQDLPRTKQIAAQSANKLAKDRVNPPTLNSDMYRNLSYLGQAYEGQSLAFKQKCLVCDAIYTFPVSMGRSGGTDTEVIAELDPNKANAPRGCCAEALCFVRTIAALKLEDQLENELLSLPAIQ